MTHATDPTLIERAAEAMRKAAMKILEDRIDVCFATVDKHNGVGPTALNASAFGAELAELYAAIRDIPAIPEAGEEAVRAEREACAKIAEDPELWRSQWDGQNVWFAIAAAIRSPTKDNAHD